MLLDIATKTQYNHTMTDQIFLHGLTIPARIGVFAHEKIAPQDIRLDIELTVDLRPAAQSDTLDDTLDYAALAKQLAAHCLAQHIELVEALAQQLADICLHDKRVQQVHLTLGKPHALANAASVGVRITRAQKT
jgi:dihydroneopterin aldolase